MAHKYTKSAFIVDGVSEYRLVSEMPKEMINDFFAEVKSEKELNPFFGAQLMRRADPLSEFIKTRGTVRLNALMADLYGTLEPLKPLDRITEELSPMNCDIVPDIYVWALLQWDIEPTEIPVYDKVNENFMSQLYDTVSVETLNYYNSQLFAAKHIAKTIIIELNYSPLPDNVQRVLKGFLELI